MESSKIMNILFLLVIGLPYLAIKGVVWAARKAWQVIVVHRGAQILLSSLLVLFLFALWVFGPVVTGRLSLLSRAETLARNAEGRNTLDMENDLRRKAFRLGFQGAITQKDAVSIERTYAQGITLCSIRFEFEREVNLLGVWHLKIPVSGKVEEPVEPPGESGKSLDEILAR